MYWLCDCVGEWVGGRTGAWCVCFYVCEIHIHYIKDIREPPNELYMEYNSLNIIVSFNITTIILGRYYHSLPTAIIQTVNK